MYYRNDKMNVLMCIHIIEKKYRKQKIQNGTRVSKDMRYGRTDRHTHDLTFVIFIDFREKT